MQARVCKRPASRRRTSGNEEKKEKKRGEGEGGRRREKGEERGEEKGGGGREEEKGEERERTFSHTPSYIYIYTLIIIIYPGLFFLRTERWRHPQRSYG